MLFQPKKQQITLVLLGDGIRSLSGVELKMMFDPSFIRTTTCADFLSAVLRESSTFYEVFQLYPKMFDLDSFDFAKMLDWEILDMSKSCFVKTRNETKIAEVITSDDHVYLVSRARQRAKVTVVLDIGVILSMLKENNLDLFNQMAELGSDVLQFFIPHVVIEVLDRVATGELDCGANGEKSILGNEQSVGKFVDKIKRSVVDKFVAKLNVFKMKSTTEKDVYSPYIIGSNMKSNHSNNTIDIILESVLDLFNGSRLPNIVLVTSDIHMAAKAGGFNGKCITKILPNLREIPILFPHIRNQLHLRSSKLHLELSGFSLENCDEASITNYASASAGGKKLLSVTCELLFEEKDSKIITSPRALMHFCDEKTCEHALAEFQTKKFGGISFRAARTLSVIGIPQFSSPWKKATGNNTSVAKVEKKVFSEWSREPITEDAEGDDLEETGKIDDSREVNNTRTSPGLPLVSSNIIRKYGNRLIPHIPNNVVVLHGFSVGCHNDEVISNLKKCIGDKSSGVLAQPIQIGYGVSTDTRAKRMPIPYFGKSESKFFVEFVDYSDAKKVMETMPAIFYKNRFLNACPLNCGVGPKPPTVRRVFRPSDPQKGMAILDIPNEIDQVDVFIFLESVIQKGSIMMFEKRFLRSTVQAIYFVEVATVEQAKKVLSSSARGELVFNGNVLRCRQYVADKVLNDWD